MFHLMDYCPKCREIEALAYSVSFKTVEDHQGGSNVELFKDYYCQQCGNFVKSQPWDSEESVGYWEDAWSASLTG